MLHWDEVRDQAKLTGGSWHHSGYLGRKRVLMTRNGYKESPEVLERLCTLIWVVVIETNTCVKIYWTAHLPIIDLRILILTYFLKELGFLLSDKGYTKDQIHPPIWNNQNLQTWGSYKFIPQNQKLINYFKRRKKTHKTCGHWHIRQWSTVIPEKRDTSEVSPKYWSSSLLWQFPGNNEGGETEAESGRCPESRRKQRESRETKATRVEKTEDQSTEKTW